MTISSNDLRKRFLNFFKKKGHQTVLSAPLLPKDDPTLLFVNAGMVPLKDGFTGKEKREYKKATSSQKCVRAGGKHNDLENVGQTARHHTFFEMLGNFSFGDYFKEEACLYAWEFLTKEIGLDPKKLSVTVFSGTKDLPADTESEQIWRDVVGVPTSSISRKGLQDNFWSMGDTGPCGPCSEIHYDRGNKTADFGDEDKEGDQILEVWNLVFMQYEKHKDGKLTPLPAPSVDTGMGLERLATVVNDLTSNYESDLLKPLVSLAAKLSAKKYKKSASEDDMAMRVIADHSRATTFLLADGVFPSNEGRGYVLRRIMRRAIRYGAKLGLDEPFFHTVCLEVLDVYNGIFSELKTAKALIEKTVHKEEVLFRKTLERGLELFHQKTKSLKKGDKLDGDLVFKLYETYGFPPDLTSVLADENKFTIDWKQFEKAKSKHAQVSSSGDLGLSSVDDIYKELRDKHGPTDFSGHTPKQQKGRVIAVLKNKESVAKLKTKEKGFLLFDKTDFYGESGGQVGDTGTVLNKQTQARVNDTKKFVDLHVHEVTVEKGSISVGDKLEQNVDLNRRHNTKIHHSATHLLHSALRQKLGDHVTQKGSLVEPGRLRFDFSHFEALTPTQIEEVETLVNDWVLENIESTAAEMTIDKAKKKGAMALFGEKYGNKVRVVDMGPHSTELCGGTHVERTGDIGFFKILSESPLASGVRRIEAIAGKPAVIHTQHERKILKQTAQELGVSPVELPKRIQALQETLTTTQKSLSQTKSKEAALNASQAVKKARTVKGVQVYSEIVSSMDTQTMHGYADKLRDSLKSGIVVLGINLSKDKCLILVTVSKDLTGRYHAGKIVGQLAKIVDGKGGGRPNFAQAGGTKTENLKKAIKAIDELI